MEIIKRKISEIRSRDINKNLDVEGIIARKSKVNPIVKEAEFKCPNCEEILSVEQISNLFREPLKCTSCEYDGSFTVYNKRFSDIQMIVLEEIPNKNDIFDNSAELHVFLHNDLTSPSDKNILKVGSKIKVAGKLVEVPIPAEDGAILTKFEWALEADKIYGLN